MDPPGPEMFDFPNNNPLLCPICHDYFTEPCILNCYHTFCSRCLRGREQDRKLICPYCRQPTLIKDGLMLPPPDTLMRQLIDIANSENPPCSNCDKRDRASMYHCNTCGQALCSNCRDNTHRAKMFSAHEVVHMSKCTKEPKRCPQHTEPYIMYSPLQNTMLCVNCFRDTPPEVRSQCLDIDTAHLQSTKHLSRAQNAITDLQTSVRDSILALKSLMDELRRNMDSEKHTINTFCQGMQEAMAKTHAAMIMEVQRQFESKDRVYRGQLLLLGSVMPVLQLHLVLCATFTAAANKYQFLELCPALIERLGQVGQLSQPVRSLQSSSIKTNYRSEFAQSLEPWIGPQAVSQHVAEIAATSRSFPEPPPTTKKQQNLLKTKVLEAETSFATHCRSFESQIRDLNQQFNTVKDKVTELHKDITAIRKAQTPPLINRYELLSRECNILETSLERQQEDLEKMGMVFEAAWEEQLWRIRVEQEVFSCQKADVMMLRNELKRLSEVKNEMEVFVKSFGQFDVRKSVINDEIDLNLQSFLDHFGRIHQSLNQHQSEQNLGKIPRSRSRVLGQFFDKVRPNSSVGCHERERSKSAGQTDKIGKIKKPQQVNMERLETQIKEKLQDFICQKQLASKSDTETEHKLIQNKKILYKKINKSCDRINLTQPNLKIDTKALIHGENRDTQKNIQMSQPNLKSIHTKTTESNLKSTQKNLQQQKTPSKSPRKPKIYPYSDGEDNVFYSLNDSADSMSTSSRRSSLETPDKTLVVVINRRNKNLTLAQKQRSWETFPPKRKHHHVCHKLSAPGGGGTTSAGMSSGGLCSGGGLSGGGPLRKTDSFEGHEEAVKSLVAAVQETRRKPKLAGGSGGGGGGAGN
ncbi:RING finger protein 207-like [Onthophagus taurus]|uniref:RING finger protein 207-like n=1 Tax=Onthophagus taurus TaxID=166361 RepID=UPI000C1FDD60|nr:RING finger protein 207-like [Onthophagus taurus]